MKTLISIAMIAAVIGMGLGTVLGVLPLASDLLGTSRPRDLGIRYSEEEQDRFFEASQTYIAYRTDIDPGMGKSISYSGTKTVATKFTPEELSARLSYDRWAYLPISDVQISIHDDGIVEVSALLHLSRIEGFLKQIELYGREEEQVFALARSVGLLDLVIPVYVKGWGAVNENNPSLTIDRFELGRLVIPSELFGAEVYGLNIMKSTIASVPDLFVNSATFVDGKLAFSGVVPLSTTALSR